MPTGLRDPSKPPRQMLTFMGQHLKHEALKADLESLVMTPAELDQLGKDIKAGKLDSLDDPFALFPNSAAAMQQQAAHDHAHEHDDKEATASSSSDKSK